MKWISNNNKINIWKNWKLVLSKKLIQLKPLSKLIKNKKKVEKNTKIKNERRASPIDPIDIRRIIRKYYEQLCANNFKNIDEVDKFLEKCYFQNGYMKKYITWIRVSVLQELNL